MISQLFRDCFASGTSLAVNGLNSKNRMLAWLRSLILGQDDWMCVGLNAGTCLRNAGTLLD